jgi:hypothetical protein
MKHLFTFICAALLITSAAYAQNDTTPNRQQEPEVIPTVSASSDDLSESVSDQNISGMLASSRDIYAATAAYRLTQAGFRYRGYRSEQFNMIINGVLN